MPHLLILDHAIYYESHGDGPPVLLLHHATGCRNDWRGQIQTLQAAGYHTIVYDRHGFGQSDPLPAWPVGYHQHGVDELIALLDALALNRVTLVGHSDGATISLMAAAQHPDRIAALVAEAPHMWIEPEWLETGFETFRQQVIISDRFWRAMRRDHGDRAEQVVHRWRHRWLDPAYRHWNVGDHLDAIACPVFIIHGARDIFFPISHSQAIAAHLAHAEFWLLDHAGHTPHLEARDAFDTRLLAFLQRHWPP